MIMIFVSVFFVALIFSMFGMGGGLFYLPLFLLFIGNHADASLLSFICIFVTASSSMISYYRRGLIDSNLVCLLGLPLVIMVFLTGFLVATVPTVFIKIILGGTLLCAGCVMTVPSGTLGWLSGLIGYLKKHFPDEKYYFSPFILSPVTALVGFLCGISGVAGGVFEIPLMAGLLRVNVHSVVATSSAIVTLSALLGIVGRVASYKSGILGDWPFLIGIIFCALLGGMVGPKISVRFKKSSFKKVCGVFVSLIGLFYIFKVITIAQ